MRAARFTSRPTMSSPRRRGQPQCMPMRTHSGSGSAASCSKRCWSARHVLQRGARRRRTTGAVRRRAPSRRARAPASASWTSTSCRSSNASATSSPCSSVSSVNPTMSVKTIAPFVIHSVSLTCWTIRIAPLTVLTSISPSVARSAHSLRTRPLIDFRSRRGRARLGHRHLDRAGDAADRDAARRRTRPTSILPLTVFTSAASVSLDPDRAARHAGDRRAAGLADAHAAARDDDAALARAHRRP